MMQATAGDIGNPQASDPVNRVPSRVQAVACYYPPTDFLNYGGEGVYAFTPNGILNNFRVALDVREVDPKTGLLERLVERENARDCGPNFSDHACQRR